MIDPFELQRKWEKWQWGKNVGRRERIFVIQLGWKMDRHEGQTVRGDLGRKMRQGDRQNREIGVQWKKEGNEQWNERERVREREWRRLPVLPLSTSTQPSNVGSQGTERQEKKELPVAAITEAKWYDVCVCETFLQPLVCESRVYRCKLNRTSCTIFLFSSFCWLNWKTVCYCQSRKLEPFSRTMGCGWIDGEVLFPQRKTKS